MGHGADPGDGSDRVEPGADEAKDSGGASPAPTGAGETDGTAEPVAGSGGAGETGGGGTAEPVAGGGRAGGDGGGGTAEPVAGGGGAGQIGGNGGAGSGAAGSAGPAELLGEVRALRRRARLARHAYWFPLVLFGLLTCASVPFYIQHFSTRPGTVSVGSTPGPRILQSGYLGGLGLMRAARGLPYYWLGAMLLGVTATVFWYRWRGNRVGLRTPARGYLITGLIIVAVALLLPLAGRDARVGLLIMPGDLVVRGTFPLVLIGLGLCFLAWAERSLGLTVIAVAYLALALLASLYDIENVFYNWFGWGIEPAASGLPNVLLPALVLLLSGAGAWVVQRRQRPLVPEN